MNHISDLQWDELVAGDLDAEAAREARAHAASCPGCAARFAEIRGGASKFSRKRPSVLWAVGVIAAAALAFVVIRPARPTDEVRTKGGGGAKLVLVDGAGRVLRTGDRIAPGDRLQATYASTRDGFGAVLSRDGAGSSSVYVPMVALPAGEGSYPQSTILDAVLGEETITLVWCERAVPLTALDGCTTEQVVLDKR